MNLLVSRCRPQAGSVLVPTLFITILILGVGLTAMLLFSSPHILSAGRSRRQEALLAAESGLERAMSILRARGTSWSSLLRGCGHAKDDAPARGGKGMVFCAPTSSTPLPLADIAVAEVTTGRARAGTAHGASRYTVYLRNDAAEARAVGGSWFEDENRRIVLRAEGTSRDQMSPFAVEVIVTQPLAEHVPSCYSEEGGCGGQGTSSGWGALGDGP